MYKFGIVRHYNDEKGTGFITEIQMYPELEGRPPMPRPSFENDYYVSDIAIKPYMPTPHPTSVKRLLTGEYVSFTVDNRHTPQGNQKQRVARVFGLFGGPLLFEQGDLRYERYTKINQIMYPPRDQNTGTISEEVGGSAADELGESAGVPVSPDV